MSGPAHLFRQTISFALPTGRDVYNAPTLGEVSTARARVQPHRKLIRDAFGAEHLASHVVYTEAALTLAHRVWFPGENTADPNAARRPVGVDPFVNGEGVTVYYKVWF